MTEPFSHLNDDLLGALPAHYADITKHLQELVELIAVDSYEDMGKAEQHRARLLELENNLADTLTPALQPTADCSLAPLDVRQSWLRQ